MRNKDERDPSEVILYLKCSQIRGLELSIV